MKIHWTETAEAHLDAIYAHIAQDSKTYALRTVDRITKRSKQIGTFPLVAKHQNTMQIKLEKYSSVHTESFITLKKIK
ncbi:MAG: type II toxin-antitoxin system RelE/ParE family toxin [Nitrospira sp.]|nr:type II toxin-antitoxin system RelE/ParE family toxin [Nitrospira sp.]